MTPLPGRRPRGFRLEIRPDEGDSYSLTLFERNGAPGLSHQVIGLGSSAVRPLEDLVQGAIKDSDAPISLLGSGRVEVVDVPEQSGVRLALALITGGKIKKRSRVEAIKAGISAMSDEEVYYWYAKCVGLSQSNGRRALRLLLAPE